MCYRGGCHAPLGCAWSDFNYFFESRRDECYELCVNVDLEANPFSGCRCQWSGTYASDGTPCGDSMQCMAAAEAGDSGEVCVPSASLDPPEPRETPPPTQPPTTVEPTTPPPTQPPTQTRAPLCPLQGWDRFRLANDHAVNATPDLTVTLSPEACMVECLNRRCKGFSLPSGNPNDPRPCYLYTTTTPAIPRYESMNLTPEQGMATYVRKRQCMPAGTCDTSSSASELFTMLPGVRPKSATARSSRFGMKTQRRRIPPSYAVSAVSTLTSASLSPGSLTPRPAPLADAKCEYAGF